MTAARWGIGAVAIGVPIIFYRSGGDPFGVPKLALLLVGVGLCWVFVACLRTSESMPAGLIIPVTAAALPTLCSWAANPHKGWTWLGEYARFQGLLSALALAGFSVLLGRCFRSRPRSLAVFITIAGTTVGTYGLVQMFGLDPFSWSFSDNAASTVGHSNFAGAVIAMSLPVTLALWAHDGHRRWYAVSTIVCSLALIGTFSQGAWIALIGGGAVFVGVALRPRFPRGPLAGVVVAACISLASVGAVISSQAEGSPLRGSSTWARGVSWRTAVDIAREQPLFGAGPNAFAFRSSAERPAVEALLLERANDPHSIPLSRLSNEGLFGLTGLFVLAVWAILRTLAAEGWLAGGFAGAAVAYLVVSGVTVNEISMQSMFWCAVVGLSITSDHAPNVLKATADRTRSWGGTAVGLSLGGLACAWGLGVLGADLAFGRAIAAVHSGDPQAANEAYALMIDIPGNHFHQRQIIGESAGAAALADPTAAGPFWALARAAHGSIEVFPYVRYRGSSAYWLSQRSAYDPAWIDEASSLWQGTRFLDPYDPAPLVERAMLLLRLGRDDQAAEELITYMRDLEATGNQLTGIDAEDVFASLALTRTRDAAPAREFLEEAVGDEPEGCLGAIADFVFEHAESQSLIQREEIPPLLRIRCAPSSLALIADFESD